MTILQPDAFIEDNNITEVETLIVVTKEEIPYVMMNSGKIGNAAYDGFAIDLLKVRINSTFINPNLNKKSKFEKYLLIFQIWIFYLIFCCNRKYQ